MTKVSIRDGQVTNFVLCVYLQQILECCASSTTREVVTRALSHILLVMFVDVGG